MTVGEAVDFTVRDYLRFCFSRKIKPGMRFDKVPHQGPKHSVVAVTGKIDMGEIIQDEGSLSAVKPCVHGEPYTINARSAPLAISNLSCGRRRPRLARHFQVTSSCQQFAARCRVTR